ncbi:ABC transporter ATP-binding protein [Streptomyces sp. NBC_00893]|uniref:ABC transporter ATP-binding protein n=1 Tax=Streptomyces sp. NBC_00893 TaxID=2975862 RepID=UPI0022586012|nr:ABC transporter ATP-binding protein [Streptomyces sp. NBC_00893]MCX4845665.1 ABC transporter ATP-binding protein/permease [Streptomyces sp. NBC_00893]
MRRRLHLLLSYLAPNWRTAVFLLVLLFAEVGLSLWNPQLLGRFIDRAKDGADVDTLVRIALVFIALTVAHQIVVSVAGYFAEDLGWRATNRMRMDLTDHCLDLDLGFHKEKTPGELIKRVDGDVATLAQFFSTFTFQIFANLLLSLGILAVSFGVDWRLGLILLVFSLVVIPVLRRTQRVASPYFHRLRQDNADIAGFLEERIMATEDIKANGSDAWTRGRLDALLERLRRTMRSESVAFRASSSALELSVAGATAAILVASALLLRGGGITLGTVYVSYFYASLLSLTLFRISNRVDGLQTAIAGMDRIAELSERRTAVPDTGHGTLPEGRLSLSFDDVDFAYVDGRPTLRRVGLRLPAGESLGLLGRTGSGKTTIGRLLYRGMDPQQGSVRLGGVDIRTVPLAELRSRVGVVTQDVHVLHASVRDNITLFDPDVRDERIEEAMSVLGMREWLDALPEGLDTVISDGALSAGQAQLLTFARVFLRDPDVVLLDEASSRLDPATERIVGAAVRKLLQGRTAIVIAHHLDTVGQLDHIAVLEAGEVAESGPRGELAGTEGSRFSALLAGAA